MFPEGAFLHHDIWHLLFVAIGASAGAVLDVWLLLRKKDNRAPLWTKVAALILLVLAGAFLGYAWPFTLTLVVVILLLLTIFFFATVVGTVYDG